MSVYNGELYLKEAIESILNQSFKDFEFLILDDASSDKSYEIVTEFDDSRIKVFRNESNLRLAKSLNKLLDASKGEYIVRMDADDVSLPDRLENQINFMDQYTNIGMAGAARIVYENGSSRIYNNENSLFLNEKLHKKNLIAHPTVIIRSSLLNKYKLRYNEEFSTAQDYELWVRMSKLFDIANMSTVVLIYRHHDNQTRVQKKEEQKYFSRIVENRILVCEIFKNKRFDFLNIYRVIINSVFILAYKISLILNKIK
jgi:glycosyltransferase involved in cell wall biosynthesis